MGCCARLQLARFEKKKKVLMKYVGCCARCMWRGGTCAASGWRARPVPWSSLWLMHPAAWPSTACPPPRCAAQHSNLHIRPFTVSHSTCIYQKCMEPVSYAVLAGSLQL